MGWYGGLGVSSWTSMVMKASTAKYSTREYCSNYYTTRLWNGSLKRGAKYGGPIRDKAESEAGWLVGT